MAKKPLQDTTLLKVADDILLEAADYIEEHGWTRHVFHRRGRSCILGAIRAVVSADPFNLLHSLGLVAELKLSKYVKAKGYRGIAPFNDDAKTTRKMVLQTLRDAAKGKSDGK